MLNENNKFQDETDFWKISGFDHAWLVMPFYLPLGARFVTVMVIGVILSVLVSPIKRHAEV